MELVKTYKVKKSSRNKLTKKQLNELRSRHYIIFERSWEAFIFRLNYIKAVCRTNTELHKYSLNRVRKLFDVVNASFAKELYEIGAVNSSASDMICYATIPKIRRIKLSILS